MKYALKSRRLYIFFTIFLLLAVSLGIVIVPIEQSLNPNTKFKTLEDGIWWAFTTVTSVGYGDYYPITTAGRVIGVILETAGVIVFGLIIAFMTISLLRREQQFNWGRTMERFDSLEEKIDHLSKEQNFTLKEKNSLKKV